MLTSNVVNSYVGTQVLHLDHAKKSEALVFMNNNPVEDYCLNKMILT